MVCWHGQCLILCLAGAAAVRTGLHDAHASSGEDPETVDFGPGEKPVKKYLQMYEMYDGGETGLWVQNAVPDNENASYSESKSGRVVAIQGGSDGDKPTKFGARTNRQWVERAWARQIHSNKSYHVTLDNSTDMGAGSSVLFLFELTTGIVPALLGLFVAIFMFPCFVVGLFCKCALSSDTDESENTEPPHPKSDQVPATGSPRPIPRLKQSWFTYIAAAKKTQVTLVVFSMSELLHAAFETYQMKRLVMKEPIFGMLDIGIPVAQLALCVSVVMGIRATKTCQILAEGATAPEDLVDTMHRELRWSVLLPFVPQALIQGIMSGITIFCFVGVCASSIGKPEVLVYAMVPLVLVFGENSIQVAFQVLGNSNSLVDIVCHQTLLFHLMLLFMLDAYIAARVVTSHVNVISKRLKDPLSLEELKEVHMSCAQLVKGPLTDLSVISQPTFAIAALNWLYAFLVAFKTLLYGDNMPHLFAILFCHIPIGLSCLLLPATVSDACAQVTRHLNEQRANPNQDDVQRQIDVTERFINGVNDGQGLGFVLYGTGMVVNKRAIFTGAAKVAGIASIVLPAASELFTQQRASHELLFGK